MQGIHVSGCGSGELNIIISYVVHRGVNRAGRGPTNAHAGDGGTTSLTRLLSHEVDTRDAAIESVNDERTEIQRICLTCLR